MKMYESNVRVAYRDITDNQESADFRLSPEDAGDAPAHTPLPPEELQTRRSRFDKIVGLLQSFDPDFDGAPYRYSELIDEALSRLSEEKNRVMGRPVEKETEKI